MTPSLSCAECPIKSQSNIFSTVRLDIDEKMSEKLEAGESFFYFSCHPGPSHTEHQKKLIQSIINVSCFGSESAENNVPFVNIYDNDDAHQYTVILTQAVYLLPKLTEKRIDPDFLASSDYHKNCQPKGTTVHADECAETTFRFTKQIIPFLYNLTIQFKVSQLPHECLEALRKELNVPFSHGILLERTKKNKTKIDSTAKVKSVLLYFPVEGGYLVHNTTVVLNTFIPSIVTPIIQTFNQGGAHEVEETVERTRAYIQKVENMNE